ncbi:MAG: hypothetical protein GY859_11190 [Desulfobacterales bacterium]|nr:hypothetical protein [Desulfobacterales bacterium]
MTLKKEHVQFDVLIKGRSAGQTPNLKNIDGFKPTPEDIEICLRWFARQGIAAHPTEFGLAGETDRDAFESVLKVRLVRTGPGSAGPPFTMSSAPSLPGEIAGLIDQITLSAPPEFF